MRTNNMKAILKAALRVVCFFPSRRCGSRPAAGQPDCRSGHRNPARRLGSANVGLQLRHGRSWLDCDLRQIESGCWCWRLVPIVITVPIGQTLLINLTNSLTSVPTSLTIVGQLERPRNFGNHHPSRATLSDPTWAASSNDPIDGSNTPPPKRHAYSRSPRKWQRERRLV